jgi:DNA-binding NarL/FixJ family response regulator
MNDAQSRLIRVLLVEDHEVVRAGIRLVLEREPDIEVVGEAANGKDALRMIRRLTPDVVILDIEMPVMNGFEVLQKLAEDHITVRILVLSAYMDKYFIQGVMEYGVDGCLSKSEGPEKVATAVREIAPGAKVYSF